MTPTRRFWATQDGDWVQLFFDEPCWTVVGWDSKMSNYAIHGNDFKISFGCPPDEPVLGEYHNGHLVCVWEPVE